MEAIGRAHQAIVWIAEGWRGPGGSFAGILFSIVKCPLLRLPGV
jgi:hypothetical protein